MKKRMLRFPAIGSDHPVPVYDRPERGEKETDKEFEAREAYYQARAHVIAHVRLLARDEVRDWTNRYSEVFAKDHARKLEKKKETIEQHLGEVRGAAEHLLGVLDALSIETIPAMDDGVLFAKKRLRLILDAPIGLSKEAQDELIALNRELVLTALTALEGVEVGGIELDDRSLAPEKRLELVHGCDMLGVVAMACQVGQYPKPQQLEPSGS